MGQLGPRKRYLKVLDDQLWAIEQTRICYLAAPIVLSGLLELLTKLFIAFKMPLNPLTSLYKVLKKLGRDDGNLHSIIECKKSLGFPGIPGGGPGAS